MADDTRHQDATSIQVMTVSATTTSPPRPKQLTAIFVPSANHPSQCCLCGGLDVEVVDPTPSRRLFAQRQPPATSQSTILPKPIESAVCTGEGRRGFDTEAICHQDSHQLQRSLLGRSSSRFLDAMRWPRRWLRVMYLALSVVYQYR